MKLNVKSRNRIDFSAFSSLRHILKMMQKIIFKFSLWMLFAMPACGESITYIDPIVDSAVAESYVPVGDPILELGFYSEQLYDRLKNGDKAPVINGSQGGRWMMPAIRATGIGLFNSVNCSITTLDDGVEIAQADDQLTFSVASDGWIEVQAFPIPVLVEFDPTNRDPLPINHLLDRKSSLYCQLVDLEQRVAELSVNIFLSDG